MQFWYTRLAFSFFFILFLFYLLKFFLFAITADRLNQLSTNFSLFLPSFLAEWSKHQAVALQTFSAPKEANSKATAMARAVKQSPSTALSFPVPPPRCTTATAMALPLATNRTPALRPVRLPPAAVVRLPRRRIASLDWPRRPQLSRPVAVSSTAWSQTSLPSLSRLPLYARLQWRSTSTVCEFFHLVCNYLRWHCIWRHTRQWCVCAGDCSSCRCLILLWIWLSCFSINSNFAEAPCRWLTH